MSEQQQRSSVDETGAGAGGLSRRDWPVPARDVRLSTSPVPAVDVVSGDPATGSRVLAALEDVEVGIWEMTPGSARDVESDELFVVLSGVASIWFDDGRVVALRAGDVMSLVQGQRATWTVTKTLRKVYVLSQDVDRAMTRRGTSAYQERPSGEEG